MRYIEFRIVESFKSDCHHVLTVFNLDIFCLFFSMYSSTSFPLGSARFTPFALLLPTSPETTAAAPRMEEGIHAVEAELAAPRDSSLGGWGDIPGVARQLVFRRTISRGSLVYSTALFFYSKLLKY